MSERTWKTSRVAAAALLALSASAHAGTTVVLPGPGTPLQDAIDAASPGDTLRLGGGIFFEAVVVDKPLRLIGATANPAILHGGCGSSSRVQIASDGVRIKNVAIDGAADSAIDVAGRSDVRLQQILMTSHCAGAEHGVRVVQSSAVKMIRCDTVGFTEAGCSIGGIAENAAVSVTRGSAQLNGRGVLLEDSAPGLRIRGVRALNNSIAGIALRTTDGALVAGNTVSDNATGIALDADSDENRIRGNRLNGNGVDGDDQGSSNCPGTYSRRDARPRRTSPSWTPTSRTRAAGLPAA